MILACGPSQASSATLQGSTAQVRRWPSLYTEQKAMCDSVTWGFQGQYLVSVLYLGRSDYLGSDRVAVVNDGD